MNGHPFQEWRRGEYRVSTDPSALDVNAVFAYLSQESYWAAGISRETVVRSIESSICFGIYLAAEQVGFCRVVSDRATFAYLGDVYVLEAHRGRGLSKWLMECVLAHPELQGLRRWVLATHDAQGLYAQFGFKPLRAPERFMELHDPNVYKSDV